MPNPLINIGAAIGDGTGEVGPRQWLQKVNRLPNPDSMINAGSGDYTGTIEQKITAAIAAAVLAGAKYVFVPQSMLPYNASLVTFNPAVQMLREGGAPRWLDLQAYGADSSGSGTLCDAAVAAAIARAVYLKTNNLGAGMASAGATIYAPQGTYYVSLTIDLVAIGVCQFVGDGPRLTRIVTSASNTAGINACNYVNTGFTVLRGFSLFQSGLVIPSAAIAGNYGIRNTTGVGFQLLIDEVEVNYFANSAIFIEGFTGPTVISNCSIQNNAGWGIEIAKNAGNSGENIQVLAGNIHDCWGGIKVEGADGCQFHAMDIELGARAKWPCIYLTGAAYGNSFYECTISAQPVAPLVNPSNGIVVTDDASGTTFINGINIAGNGQGTDNYRFVGATDKTTVIGGLHTNTLVGGGFFAVVQAINTTFINNTLATGSYGSGKNTLSEGTGIGNFSTVIGAGGTGPIGTAGIAFDSSSLQVGRRIKDGRIQLTSGTTPALDASLGDYFTLNITSNIAVVIAIPSNAPVSAQSQEITIAIRNGSGGALTTPPTFNTGAGGFKFPAGVIVNPVNGTQVLYKFRFDDVQVFWYLTGAPTTVGY